jgi:hypothetical protein
MNSDTPAHDFLLPRLTALVEEAVANGIARDIVVAVLTDLVTAPPFNETTSDRKRAGDKTPQAGEEHRFIERIAAPDGVP